MNRSKPDISTCAIWTICPITIIKNRTADGQPLKHGNTRYSNGVSLPAQTELTVNNFTREDGGYGAFEAEAFNPSSQTVLLRLIAKNADDL